jgi:hypothetical protein
MLIVSWRLYDNGRVVCGLSLSACICFGRLVSALVCCNVRASTERLDRLSSLVSENVQIC